MKSRQTIIIVQSVYRKAQRVFDKADDFTVIVGPEDETFLAGLAQKEKAFAIVLGTEIYTESLYKFMPEGGVLARFGVGCDGLDFQQVRKYNLHVTNTPGVLDQTVAEYTVFLAGELLRRTGASSLEVKKDDWSPFVGRDLFDKNWTILGIGAIGKKLSRILSFGFGVNVTGLDLPGANEEYLQREYGMANVLDDYSNAVSNADIVSVHLPSTIQTRHYLNEKRLEQIRQGALLINTGRGSLIDETALYKALKIGKLAGAGLDVFEMEPYYPLSPDADLRTLNNVVMTPHIASSTAECNARMAERVLHNIRMAAEGKFNEMDIFFK